MHVRAADLKASAIFIDVVVESFDIKRWLSSSRTLCFCRDMLFVSKSIDVISADGSCCSSFSATTTSSTQCDLASSSRYPLLCEVLVFIFSLAFVCARARPSASMKIKKEREKLYCWLASALMCYKCYTYERMWRWRMDTRHADTPASWGICSTHTNSYREWWHTTESTRIERAVYDEQPTAQNITFDLCSPSSMGWR